MKFLVCLFLTLALICGVSSDSSARAVIVLVPDTLMITLPQGDSGESLEREALLASPLLRAMVDVTNRFPESFIQVDQWRSDTLWAIARGNKRVSRALDGGVLKWTETYFKEVLTDAGLSKEALENRVEMESHCCLEYPTVWIRVLWKEPEEEFVGPPEPARKDTIVVEVEKPFIQELFSKCHLGLGASTSPYNGTITLNLEVEFDSLKCLELSFGHSTPLFAKTRTVDDPLNSRMNRLTDDHMFSGKFIRYLEKRPWFGIHFGLLRIENVMRYNQKHISCFQGLFAGPTIRKGKLSASASLIYGTYKSFERDTNWEFRGIAGITVYWR